MMMLLSIVTSMPGSTCQMPTERTALNSHTQKSIDKVSFHCPVLGSANRLYSNAAEAQMIYVGGTYKVAGLLME